MSAPSAAPRRRLWRHLWVWAMGALLLVWATLVAVAYHTGVHEAEEITDGQLVSVAQLLLRQPWPAEAGGATASPTGVPVPLPGIEGRYAPPVRVALWQGERLWWDSDGLAASLPQPLPPGHHTLVLTAGGEPRVWRWFVAQSGERRVAVAIDTTRHRALGRDIAEHVVRPALVLLPLLAVLLAWGIRRGLAPLQRLTTAIDRLDARAGETLPAESRFVELSSIVRALNGLVQRLQQLWERERRFTSDVAHELRTPLAALALQARVAREQPGQPAGDAALRAVEEQALRAGHVLAQLLALARAQGPQAPAWGPVDLAALARDVAAEHAALAHERGQTLGVTAPETPVVVPGQAALLALALRNLVDNALRHTPRGTQVDIAVAASADGVTLTVRDDGSRAVGPPTTHTEGPGLGIGLSLVQRIADRHGAVLRHETPTAPWTTAYTLHWPATAAAASPAQTA